MTVREHIKSALTMFYTKLKGSVVNNCASTSTNLPLSANQGKVLQDQITSLNSKITNSALGNLGTTSGLTTYYIVNGNSVCISITGTYSGTLARWQRVTLCTLPEKYRPPINMTNRGVENFVLFVNKDGTVQIQNGSEIEKTYNGFAVNPSITYLL